MKANDAVRAKMREIANDIEALARNTETLIAKWREMGAHFVAGDLAAALDARFRANSQANDDMARARMIDRGIDQLVHIDPVFYSEADRASRPPTSKKSGLLESIIDAIRSNGIKNSPQVSVSFASSDMIETFNLDECRKHLAEHSCTDPQCDVPEMLRARIAYLEGKEKS